LNDRVLAVHHGNASVVTGHIDHTVYLLAILSLVFTLRVRIDGALLKALLAHAASAVEEGLLSEEEAVRVVIDEVADRGLKIEVDAPWNVPSPPAKGSRITRERRKRK
jgi:hypothetical protein